MDGLLTEIKTVSQGRPSSQLSPVTGRQQDVSEKSEAAVLTGNPTSPSDIVTVLRSKPDVDQIASVLATLDPSNKDKPSTNFDIRVAGPATAQILNALVSITIPDHWELLDTRTSGSRSRNTKTRASLLRCLSSVAGISCLVVQVRSLIATSRAAPEKAKTSGTQIQLRNVLGVISALLEPNDFALRLHTDIETLYVNVTQKQIAWKEFLSLVAASRVLSTAAEALSLAGEEHELSRIAWLGEGPRYSTWLGVNICHMASKLDTDDLDTWKAVASLTSRALSLGYTGNTFSAHPLPGPRRLIFS